MSPVHAKVTDFDPYSEGFAANPWPVYARLREATPVFRSERFDMTLLTRHRDVLRILTDRRFGRAFDGSAVARGDMPYYDRYVRVNLLETEGDTHARLRRALASALHPRRIENLAARVQQVARELIERIDPGVDVDFISEVAEPLPVIVISELLGWPAAERHRLRPWSADIVRLYEKDATRDDRERAETACREFATLLNSIAEQRRGKPRDDFISALAAREDDADGLDRDELISSCMLLLNAGHEATVNAAGNGLLALLRHPASLERLRLDPTLLESAVEETLRYDSPLHLFHRFAQEELELHGHRIGRGEKVGLLYGAANRDPEMFAEPDRFDIGRTPNRHLAFGAATHFCLGAPLARLELKTLFSTLMANTDSIELAQQTPEYHVGLVFRGLKRLRIRLG